MNLAKKTITERGDKVKQKVLVIFEDEEAYSELQIALESTTIATVFAATPDDAIRLFINHEYSRRRFYCYPQTQNIPTGLRLSMPVQTPI